MSAPNTSRLAIIGATSRAISRAFGRNAAEATLPGASDLAGRQTLLGRGLAEAAAVLELVGNIASPHRMKWMDNNTVIGSTVNDVVSGAFNIANSAPAEIMRITSSAAGMLFGTAAVAAPPRSVVRENGPPAPRPPMSY